MKRFKMFIKFIMLLIAFLFICATIVNAEDAPDINKKYKIFILHSYHPEYVTVKNNNEGIFRALDGKGYLSTSKPSESISYEYKIFYMDTKRLTSKGYIEKIALKAIKSIEDYNPDIIISVDDNAAVYVLKKLVGQEIPIVFCDLNGNPVEYGLIKSLEKPGTNITGVLERHHYKDVVRLAKLISPKIKSVSIILDDSNTSKSEIKEIKHQLEDVDIAIRKELLTSSWEKWKSAVNESQLRGNFIITPLHHSLRDTDGKLISTDDVYKWLFKNSRVPEFGVIPSQVEEGMLASISTWPDSQGYEAAIKAMRILKGEKPQNLPVTVSQIGSVDINMARAKMLGVKIPFDLLSYATTYKTLGVYEKNE